MQDAYYNYYIRGGVNFIYQFLRSWIINIQFFLILANTTSE